MANKQAFWVHGNSVQMEREGYFISKQRAGFAAIFRTHGDEWFHFAIPTPVILNGKDTTLKKIFIFYRTKGTAKITNVHIHDGEKTIESFKNLSLSGDYSTKVDKHNSWGISPVHVKFGLGISVHVDFGPKTKLGVPEIRFTSAGADFQTP